MRLERTGSLVLVIDVQERLAPAIRNGTAVVAACSRLLRGAALLGVPSLATEHCAERIGRTLAALEPDDVFPKRHFSAVREPGFRQRIGGSSVVLAGMEAHVCVTQTALDLLADGVAVAVATDACGSRRGEDRKRALQRLANAGAVLTTVETVLFEWLGSADDPAFRDVLAVMKEANDVRADHR